VKRALIFCFAAASCGDAEIDAPPANEPAKHIQAPAQPPARPLPEPAGAPTGQGAAEVVRTYYAFIEAGDYDQARRLRDKRPDLAAFAASFERYLDYHATIGMPSEIAEGGDWLYVEVPVQTYGRLKTGDTFGSVGTVSLRRSKAEPGAAWRIYTSG
jgi:hypothetical protein